MPIVWNLKKWLAVERDIYRPSELQTIQALCNALDCKLSDFCDVLPDAAKEQEKQRKVAGGRPVRLYGAKESSKNQESLFPDPHQYTDAKRDQSGKGKRKKE